MKAHHSTRRDFLLRAAGVAAGAGELIAASDPVERAPVIDCHVHCGIGQALLAPYSTENPPEHILRNMRLGDIDQCVIFPISNTTYEQANMAIAETCRRFPGKFIGFAKHDELTERFRGSISSWRSSAARRAAIRRSISTPSTRRSATRTSTSRPATCWRRATSSAPWANCPRRRFSSAATAEPFPFLARVPPAGSKRHGWR